MKFEWLKKIEWKDLLTDDLRLVESVVGEEATLELIQRLGGYQFFVSQKPLREAQKRYIKKFYNGFNARKIGLEVGASESLVRAAISETHKGASSRKHK